MKLTSLPSENWSHLINKERNSQQRNCTRFVSSQALLNFTVMISYDSTIVDYVISVLNQVSQGQRN